MRVLWILTICIFILPLRSAAWISPSALNAVSLVIQRQLTTTMCANPQVFLIPDEILRRNFDRKLQEILDFERVPTLAQLAQKKEVQYESLDRLNLLMEIAAVLQLPFETSLLAKIRLSVCVNKPELTPSPTPSANGGANRLCHLQSLFELHPKIAIDMAGRARRHLFSLTEVYPSVAPPSLRPETIVLLNHSFNFDDLKSVSQRSRAVIEDSVVDHIHSVAAPDNGIYYIPDRSFRYNRQWMDECSLGTVTSK